MAAQHGGFRKGAGRPKGSRNRATIAREARQREALAAARAANANLSAIDYLLQDGRCDAIRPDGGSYPVGRRYGPISGPLLSEDREAERDRAAAGALDSHQ